MFIDWVFSCIVAIIFITIVHCETRWICSWLFSVVGCSSHFGTIRLFIPGIQSILQLIVTAWSVGQLSSTYSIFFIIAVITILLLLLLYILFLGFTPDAKVWEVMFDKGRNFTGVKRAFDLKGHTASILSLAISADSSKMVTVSKDGSWKLWRTDGIHLISP